MKRLALLPALALLLTACQEATQLTTPEVSVPIATAYVAGPPDIFVTTTSDVADFGGGQQVGDLPGPDTKVSLREAITAANNTPGPQVIGFNIPVTDPGFDGTAYTIQPSTILPFITDDETTIDGSTQALFTGNTNGAGPEIVLNGSLVPSTPGFPGSTGLVVSSNRNLIRHLVINAFFLGSFVFGTGNVLEYNFIGTDASGSMAVPNVVTGIVCNGINIVIRGNLISGNTEFGIEILDAVGCRIQDNKIGTDVTGTQPLPNCCGISIESDNNVIGGLEPGQGNLIAYNCCGDGISVIKAAVNNAISGNSIFANGDLGIDLGADFNGDGVTPNDPGDTDEGPNHFMNFPVLTSALATPRQLVVRGTIDTPNPETVTIEFFANAVPSPGGDPSGHGEGAVFLDTVTPNKRGKFTATLPPVQPGTLISATATDADGNTSEFALNIAGQAPGG